MNWWNRLRLKHYLHTHILSVGLADPSEGTCSIGAINWVLRGKRYDDHVPDDMTLVVGDWIRKTQDSISIGLRNSKEWKDLLVIAAGTNRDRDAERKLRLEGEMWSCLALLNPLAKETGNEDIWKTMLMNKNARSCELAMQNMPYSLDLANAAYYARSACRCIEEDENNMFSFWVSILMCEVPCIFNHAEFNIISVFEKLVK